MAAVNGSTPGRRATKYRVDNSGLSGLICCGNGRRIIDENKKQRDISRMRAVAAIGTRDCWCGTPLWICLAEMKRKRTGASNVAPNVYKVFPSGALGTQKWSDPVCYNCKSPPCPLRSDWYVYVWCHVNLVKCLATSFDASKIAACLLVALAVHPTHHSLQCPSLANFVARVDFICMSYTRVRWLLRARASDRVLLSPS